MTRCDIGRERPVFEAMLATTRTHPGRLVSLVYSLTARPPVSTDLCDLVWIAEKRDKKSILINRGVGRKTCNALAFLLLEFKVVDRRELMRGGKWEVRPLLDGR